MKEHTVLFSARIDIHSWHLGLRYILNIKGTKNFYSASDKSVLKSE